LVEPALFQRINIFLGVLSVIKQKESPCILIVEDDKDGSDFLSLLLEWKGYRTMSARSLSQALELSRKTRFDLCLLDTWLPDGSGIDLCKQIRAWDEQIPIVFYSGAAFEKDKEMAFSSGAQAYIVKPAFNGELEAAVDQFIRKGQAVP